MKNESLLFLDFDGVLCDSLPETLVCSWVAYHQFISGESPSAMPADFRIRFSRLRPFIRTGEDYIVLQDIVYRGLAVASQVEFDQLRDQAGREKMMHYREFFYQARRELLARDRAFWLSINPIFPRLRSALLKKPRHPRLYVLSTKKREFILEIFRAQGIAFLEENIIDSGNENKLGIISKALNTTSSRSARFIDDQIEHLKNLNDVRISVYLAGWGYIKQEWLDNAEAIPVISIDHAADWIEHTE